MNKEEQEEEYMKHYDLYEIMRLGRIIEESLPYNYRDLGSHIFSNLLNLSQKPNASINNFYYETEYQGKKIKIEKSGKQENCYKLSITEGNDIYIYYYIMPRFKTPVYTYIWKKGEKLQARQFFKMGSRINPIVEETCSDTENTGYQENIDGQFTDKQKELITRLSENVIDSRRFLESIINYQLRKYMYTKISDDNRIKEYVGCTTSFSSEKEKRDFGYSYSIMYYRNYIDKYGCKGYSIIHLDVTDSECSIDCIMYTNEHPEHDSMKYEQFIAENPDIDLKPLKQQIRIAKKLGLDTSKIPEGLQSPKEETNYITQNPGSGR